jgi:hypothetical protein
LTGVLPVGGAGTLTGVLPVGGAGILTGVLPVGGAGILTGVSRLGTGTGTGKSTIGVFPTDTPTNRVLDEDVPDEEREEPSSDAPASGGALGEDALGTDTLRGDVCSRDTPRRDLAPGEGMAGEPDRAIAWVPVAASAMHRLRRSGDNTRRRITYAPWNGCFQKDRHAGNTNLGTTTADPGRSAARASPSSRVTQLVRACPTDRRSSSAKDVVAGQHFNRPPRARRGLLHAYREAKSCCRHR